MCELPQAFKSVTRKARKDHKCCECYSLINRGDEYQYSSGIWEHEPRHFKQCMNCNIIMHGASRMSDAYDEGVAFEGLRDFFMEYVDSTFNGIEFLESMADQIGIEPSDLNRLLKIDYIPPSEQSTEVRK